MIEIGITCLLWPIFPLTLPFFKMHEWDSVDLEVEQKGGAIISESTE